MSLMEGYCSSEGCEGGREIHGSLADNCPWSMKYNPVCTDEDVWVSVGVYAHL